jgi:AcrR family transcriptional regulator
MYQSFRSKEDILMAYLESSGAATDEVLLNAANKHEDPKKKILGIFDYLIGMVQQQDYNGCNFLNIVSEIPKGGERIHKQIKKQKDGVRALFRKILKPVNKEHLADDLYVLFEGALIANKVHDEVWPVERARNIADLLLNQ